MQLSMTESVDHIRPSLSLKEAKSRAAVGHVCCLFTTKVPHPYLIMPSSIPFSTTATVMSDMATVPFSPC
jgi:hypothetical protein